MIQQSIKNLYLKVENSTILRCIRRSLVMLIPILLIGSFSTVVQNLPIATYQRFLLQFHDGLIIRLSEHIFQATSGMSSVYLTMCLAFSYAQLDEKGEEINNIGVIFTALSCFALWSGVANWENFHIEAFGTTGMFTALLCGLFASMLYVKISNSIKKRKQSLADGADPQFHLMIHSWLPMLIVISIFLFFYIIMIDYFKCENFTELFASFTHRIFSHTGRSLASALLYEVILNTLWFFGIHGGDVMEEVTQNLFYYPSNIEGGIVVSDIFNGSFLNLFVAMGGCGTVWCLLLAILFFSHRRNNRKLAVSATIPCLFNVSEVIILGLPVVFNPIFFIPFILTPIVMVLTSSIAMTLGLVPPARHALSWTAPIILSGYMSTESVSGAALQIFNLLLGVLIYAPFVKLYDHVCMHDAEVKLKTLVDTLQKHEESNTPVNLLSLNNNSSIMAKSLSEELKYNLKKSLPTMYYQPQYDNHGNCIGVEALLRWIHPTYSLIYPPLVIKLAEENDLLLDLEKNVIYSVLNDSKELMKILPEDAKISLNITGTTIQNSDFLNFLVDFQKTESEFCKHLTIEITEQATMNLNDTLIKKLTELRKIGYRFSIDDFSMGNTSIKYLQTNIFSFIKLDGSICQSIMNNERSCDIISSLTQMASRMNIDVIAEYVEKKEQQQLLENMGCYHYQGYLYSPAIPLDKLEKQLSSISHRRSRKLMD